MVFFACNANHWLGIVLKTLSSSNVPNATQPSQEFCRGRTWFERPLLAESSRSKKRMRAAPDPPV